MKSVFSCRSCGFISTLRSQFRVEKSILVCVDCKEEYGTDEDVTRWIDCAVKADQEKSYLLPALSTLD